MTSIKYVVACVVCAAFTDIANASFGLSYWWSWLIAAVCLTMAGYAARKMRNGKGRV